MIPGCTLLLVQAGRVNGFVLGIQALIGTQIGPELGDLGQRVVISGTQLWRVSHAVEVIDGAPGRAQLLGRNVEHGWKYFPLCGKVSA